MRFFGWIDWNSVSEDALSISPATDILSDISWEFLLTLNKFRALFNILIQYFLSMTLCRLLQQPNLANICLFKVKNKQFSITFCRFNCMTYNTYLLDYWEKRKRNFVIIWFRGSLNDSLERIWLHSFIPYDLLIAKHADSMGIL